MPLLKIRSFGGDAEILGQLRPIRYSQDVTGGTLKIDGLGIDDAYAVLRALSIGKVLGVSSGAVSDASPPAPQEDPAASPAPPPPPSPPLEDAAKRPKKGRGKGASGTLFSDPADFKQASEVTGSVEAPRSPVEEIAAVHVAEGGVAREVSAETSSGRTVQPAVNDSGFQVSGREVSVVQDPPADSPPVEFLGEVISKIPLDARVKDVLVVLHQVGIETGPAMVDKCVEIASRVPVLERIGNEAAIRDRVQRAMVALKAELGI